MWGDILSSLGALSPSVLKKKYLYGASTSIMNLVLQKEKHHQEKSGPSSKPDSEPMIGKGAFKV